MPLFYLLEQFVMLVFFACGQMFDKICRESHSLFFSFTRDCEKGKLMFGDNLALAHIFTVASILFATQVVKPAFTIIEEFLLNQYILIIFQIVHLIIRDGISQRTHHMPVFIYSIIITTGIFFFKIEVMARKVKTEIPQFIRYFSFTVAYRKFMHIVRQERNIYRFLFR